VSCKGGLMCGILVLGVCTALSTTRERLDAEPTHAIPQVHDDSFVVAERLLKVESVVRGGGGGGLVLLTRHQRHPQVQRVPAGGRRQSLLRDIART
jgi:hypothetical protein